MHGRKVWCGCDTKKDFFLNIMHFNHQTLLVIYHDPRLEIQHDMHGRKVWCGCDTKKDFFLNIMHFNHQTLLVIYHDPMLEIQHDMHGRKVRWTFLF